MTNEAANITTLAHLTVELFPFHRATKFCAILHSFRQTQAKTKVKAAGDASAATRIPKESGAL